MTKSFSLDLPDEVAQFCSNNSSLIERTIISLYKSQKIDERIEAVKIITRTKASVCNWHDLELEIFKGSIGEKRS